MEHLRRYTFILVLAGNAVTWSCAEQPVANSPSRLSAIAEARTWFLDENRNLDNWSKEELLGGAELLHWTNDKAQDKTRDTARRRVGQVVSRLSESARRADKQDQVGPLIRARMIWLVMRDDRASDDYFQGAKWLTEKEKNNAVPWLLLAESAWLRGDFGTYVQASKAANRSHVVSLHAKGYRQRIGAVLDKAGPRSAEAKRELLLCLLPDDDSAMSIRHTALLQALPMVSHLFGKEVESSDSVLRYVTLGILSLPVGHAFDHNILAHLIQERDERPRGQLQSRLKAQRMILDAEAVKLVQIATSGTAAEVDRAIRDPDAIRKGALGTDPAAIETMKDSTWLEFWQKKPGGGRDAPAPGGE